MVLGVVTYSSYHFVDWVFDQVQNMITSVIFESKHKMLELECVALFYFQDKQISPKIYNTLNDANLVYDGKM